MVAHKPPKFIVPVRIWVGMVFKSHSIMVITSVSESDNPSSILGGTIAFIVKRYHTRLRSGRSGFESQ
jgi:hypothetical protein